MSAATAPPMPAIETIEAKVTPRNRFMKLPQNVKCESNNFPLPTTKHDAAQRSVNFINIDRFLGTRGLSATQWNPRIPRQA
jgi:hypothetical protein